MLNIEKYKDEIIKCGMGFAVLDNKPCSCGFCKCDRCDLNVNGSCAQARVEWLIQEYVQERQIDKIKKMSTDELAEFLFSVNLSDTKFVECGENCNECERSDQECIDRISKWLLSAAED